jgi:hypothetical protein
LGSSVGAVDRKAVGNTKNVTSRVNENPTNLGVRDRGQSHHRGVLMDVARGNLVQYVDFQEAQEALAPVYDSGLNL